jgi:hypothetical protein
MVRGKWLHERARFKRVLCLKDGCECYTPQPNEEG